MTCSERSKDPEQRRRRNKDSAFEDLPAEGYQGEFPKLPKTYTLEVRTDQGPMMKKVTYLSRTRAWYETFARSPMAVRFTTVDWMRLQDIAPLKDAYYRRPTKDLAAELRQQESLLGATPMDRWRMRLRVKPAETDDPDKPKLAEVHRLRAVDPTAS